MGWLATPTETWGVALATPMALGVVWPPPMAKPKIWNFWVWP